MGQHRRFWCLGQMKKISVFRVTRILGRVGTHIFLAIFFLEKI